MISTFKQTILELALALASANGTQQHVAMGVASQGVVNQLTFYSDSDNAKANYGTGPLVDKGAYHLPNAGGPMGFMRLNASVAGTAGAVTTTRIAPADSTGILAVSGAPTDAWQVVVTITRQGTNLAANTAAFTYSLDGGDTVSAEIAMPVGGVYSPAGAGFTLTFTNGAGPTSFKAGDVYTFTCVAPGYSVSDVNAAIDALRLVASANYFCVHLVGQAADATGAATMAAALDARAQSFALNDYRYMFFVMEAPDVSDSLLTAAFANFVSNRVAVCAGFSELSANNRVMKRSSAWPCVMRACQQTPQRALSRVRNDGQGGALPGVALKSADGLTSYRDEYATPGLDDARFTTLRTWPGQPGVFVSKGRLMAAPNTDFAGGKMGAWHLRRLMDVACTLNYIAQFPFIDDDLVRVDDVTGKIVEADAKNVESVLNNAFSIMTSNRWVSAVSSLIDRGNNILSTSTLKSKVRITPRGYASNIESEIGFFNPALAQVAA